MLGDAALKEMKLPVRVSSSDSARSAQHTPERRTPFVCHSAFEGTRGELAQELTGEPILEHVGDSVLKETSDKLLHINAPAASSSAALSCTHSGSIRDRKGLLGL
jgi:hypothetical protein